jgi:hypothetical protein
VQLCPASWPNGTHLTCVFRPENEKLQSRRFAMGARKLTAWMAERAACSTAAPPLVPVASMPRYRATWAADSPLRPDVYLLSQKRGSDPPPDNKQMLCVIE